MQKQGCNLTSSNCNKKIAGICLQWTRNYQCSGQETTLRSSLDGGSVFCQGGDCYSPVIGQNNDLHNVAYLGVFQEMQKDMNKNPLEVFKGEANFCTKYIVDFLDCCSSMKGWGKNVNLCRCSGEAKALALKREKNLCTYVGTSCSSRDPVFGKCLAKKSAYCCFNSKLAKVLQEAARSQLGMNFGSGSSPTCQGLTPEQLQRVDFTKINVEELFADVLGEAKAKMGKAFPKQMQQQMPVMQKQHEGSGGF